MAKRGRKPKIEKQINLFEVAPENADEILEHAKKYKTLVVERQKLLEQEVAEKQTLLELVHNADLQRLKDGIIKFTAGEFQVTVTPTDEKISIKEKKNKKQKTPK